MIMVTIIETIMIINIHNHNAVIVKIVYFTISIQKKSKICQGTHLYDLSRPDSKQFLLILSAA